MAISDTLKEHNFKKFSVATHPVNIQAKLVLIMTIRYENRLVQNWPTYFSDFELQFILIPSMRSC